MSDPLRATPFHARTADANRGNAWVTRNGMTLTNLYTDIVDEALAARTRVAISDISWRWRLGLAGTRVVECLQCLLTCDVAKLASGAARKTLWLSDKGGVRGAGVVARYGKQSFLLVSTAPGRAWIEAAAAQFDVATYNASDESGGLAAIGPYARATLQAAGLDTILEPLGFQKVAWRGIDVTLSRWGEHGGYEIWCDRDDGLLLWDRFTEAGAPFDLLPAGVAAMEVLDLEAGIPRPGRDYVPATDDEAAEPTPRALGLNSLIDADAMEFSGRAEFLAACASERKRLVGFQIDSDMPAPHTPLRLQGRVIGRTLGSAYSPALRRAIALAQVDAAAAIPGIVLSLTLPSSLETPELRVVTGQIVDLPFLSPPANFQG